MADVRDSSVPFSCLTVCGLQPATKINEIKKTNEIRVSWFKIKMGYKSTFLMEYCRLMHYFVIFFINITAK